MSHDPVDDTRIVDLNDRRASTHDSIDPLDSLLDAAGSAVRGHPEADQLLDSLSTALPRPPKVLRLLLLVVGAVQLAIVTPWIVGSDPFELLGDLPAEHLTRDGSLGLTVAIAALITFAMPRWAVPMFVTCSVAVVAQAVAGALEDSIADSASNELIHVPSLVLTLLVGLSGVRLPGLGVRPNPSP